MLDPRRQEKLQELVRTLGSQAQQAEKDGNVDDAARLYIKLVDVLLLLARESGDNHPLWVKYTKQAEAYQAKVKTLISTGKITDNVSNSALFSVASKPPPPVKSGPEPNAAYETSLPSGQQITTAAVEQQSPSTQNKESTFKKIFKPFQRSDSVSEFQERQTYVVPEVAQQRSSEPASMPSIRGEPANGGNSTQTFAGVPYDLFQQTLSESKYYQEKSAALAKERDSLFATLEARERELAELKSSTVLRTDYEALHSQLLQNQTSKAQLEAVTAQLERVEEEMRNSVPKSQYDDLLTKISHMVPRDVYIEAEVRAARYELELKNTVPKNVLDELASQVSLISTLSSIPLEEAKSYPQNHQTRLQSVEEEQIGKGLE